MKLYFNCVTSSQDKKLNQKVEIRNFGGCPTTLKVLSWSRNWMLWYKGSISTISLLL